MIALLLAAVATPLVHALTVLALARWPRARDGAHIVGALAQAGIAIGVAVLRGRGIGGYLPLAEPLPKVEFALAADPLGAVAGATLCGLAALCAAYSVGWARRAEERDVARFYIFSALAVGAGTALVYAANLFTLFLAYELVALASFPLLAHGGRADERGAAALYLLVIVGLGMVALLPAVVWTNMIAGHAGFAPHGVLEGKLDQVSANGLLALYAAGLGLSGLFPAHRWITAARGSPAAGAILIGLVGGLGGFCLLRVAAHVFGPALEEARIARNVILGLAALTMAGGSVAALTRPGLSERVAYACLAQLALVAAGAMLGGAAGTSGGEGWFSAALQLVAYMIAAVTLYLAAGAMRAVAGAEDLSDMVGFGRKNPWIFSAFLLGALSFAGAPPLAGAWPKLWLLVAAIGRDAIWIALAMGAAAIGAFVALVLPAARALFAPASHERLKRPDGAPLLASIPAAMSGLACLFLLFWLDPIAAYLGTLEVR